MKKILIVIHALGGGGAERVLINLVRALDKSKYNITLLSIVDSGIYRSLIPSEVHYKSIFKLPRFLRGNRDSSEGKGTSGSLLARGGKIKQAIASVYGKFWSLFPIELLYRLFIKEIYDLEIAFLEGPSTKLVSSSPNAFSKKMAWIHVDLSHEGKSHHFYKSLSEEKSAYSKYDAIVSVSEGVQKAFLSSMPEFAPRCLVIHNPIDVSEITRLSMEECELPSIAGNKHPLFLSVGRICAQKSFSRIVSAAEALKNKGIFAKFIILGEGPDYGVLRDEIVSKNLESYILLMGYQRNPYPYYRFADAFLCTSTAEGFSTTASEAAVLGLPVLTTDCAGMDELASIYKAVTICDNSTDAVVEMVEDAVINKTYQTKASVSGDYFNLENRVKVIENLIDGILDAE